MIDVQIELSIKKEDYKEYEKILSSYKKLGKSNYYYREL